MESDSFNRSLTSPKRLKTLACDLKHSDGNNLLHKIVLDCSVPNVLGSVTYINAVLLSMSDLPADTVNAPNAEGLSSLHLAVMRNNLFILKELLSFIVNIDINFKCSKQGNTALHYAAMFGHLSIIRELLDRKADVKTYNNMYHSTPVEVAVQCGHLEALKIFVKDGIDITLGKSLLFQAARYGKLNIIKFLIEKGVEVDFKSEEGDRLLIAAAVSGDVEIVEFFIINGCNVNATDFGDTPLHYAAMSGNLQVAEVLIKNGADVNVNDDSNRTPLHSAIFTSNLEMADCLIRNGANVNHRNCWEQTPLLKAVLNDDLFMVELLIRNGADVNPMDDSKWTLLHAAVYKKNFEITECLVRNGANVNSRNLLGETPLQYALKDEKITELLIRYGANANYKDDETSPHTNQL